MAPVAVNVAVIQEEKVLLTLRSDLFVWCLPGGRVEEGESLAEAAIRETREETGLEVELTRLVGTYSRLGGTFPDLHIVLFAARPTGGTLQSQTDETVDARYFTLDSLPEPLWTGYRQRVLDALGGVGGGAVWRQVLTIPGKGRLTWPDVMKMADEQEVPRNEFYCRLIESAYDDEVLEVEDHC